MEWRARARVAVSVALSIWAAAPAAAQASKQAALEFLNATFFDARMRSQYLATDTGVPAVDRLMQQLQRQPEMEQMREQMRARLITSLPALREEMADAYSLRFSEEELVALTAFFRSAPGRKYIELQPELQRIEAGIVVGEMLKAAPVLNTVLNKVDQTQELKQAERAQLEQRAVGGDRDAQYALGKLYCTKPEPGLKRSEAIAKCFEWKKRAAEAGLPEAQFDVGFSYVDGRYGNGKNGKEMFRWMKMAADQGYSNAYFYVGSAYTGNTRVFGNEATGVEIDAKQAEAWLVKSAAAGSMGAIMDLASMYFEGRVLQKNIPEAIRWYSEGASRRNVFAMRRLGEIYEAGLAGEPNPAEAMKWYKQAAGVR